MPSYDYRCTECNRKFSLTMTVAEYEKKKVKCPKCGSKKVEQRLATFYAVTSKKS